MNSLDLFQYFTEGAVLGLATGITCAVFCVPVLFGLTSRNITNMTPFKDLLLFLAGRFIMYVLVGFVFSVIGMHLKYTSIIKTISWSAIGVLLLYWGYKGFRTDSKKNKSCPVKEYMGLYPFIAGILTGLSPCPPFIAGITRVLTINNTIAGILYFNGFFITTSLFLLPSLSTLLLKHKKEFNFLASLIAICAGTLYIITGIVRLA